MFGVLQVANGKPTKYSLEPPKDWYYLHTHTQMLEKEVLV
jgi:hypothetical protein